MGSFGRRDGTALIAARDRRGDEGVRLIEVVVAFIVLLITILPTPAHHRRVQRRQLPTATGRPAAGRLVARRSCPTPSSPTTNGGIITNHPRTPPPFAGISAATTQIPKSTLAGTTYTVTADYTTQSVNNQGQSDLCSSGQPPSPSHPGVILLQVTVSWNQGNNSVTDTTAVNYPQARPPDPGLPGRQLDQQRRHRRQRQRRLGSPPGRPRHHHRDRQGAHRTLGLADPPFTLYPDENGCIFAQVPTGTYNVALGQPTSGHAATFTGYTGTPPFVTTTGTPPLTAPTNQTVTVTAETDRPARRLRRGHHHRPSPTAASPPSTAGWPVPDATILTCIATGNGTAGASAAWGGTGSTWTSTTFSGVTNLSTRWPAPQAALRPVWAWATTRVAPSSAPPRQTWAPLATRHRPGRSDRHLTQVTCPSTNGCYALGTTASGPVLLAGAVGQAPHQWTNWSVVAPASTAFTSLSSIACPTASTCELTGSAVVGAPGGAGDAPPRR